MSAAHTPGPWSWVSLDEGISHVLQNMQGVCVCSDGSAWGEYGADIDVTGPNARLIAAAPDLLAALNRALFILESPAVAAWVTPDSVYGLGTLTEIRAAIAKTEGRIP